MTGLILHRLWLGITHGQFGIGLGLGYLDLGMGFVRWAIMNVSI